MGRLATGWRRSALTRMVPAAFGLLLMTSDAASGATTAGAATRSVAAGDPSAVEASVIATYRDRIPRLMAEQRIPGLAVAVVDGGRTVWTQGFGHVDGPDSPAVGVDTIFSVQSMSKSFTATAVMRAVQDGKVSLDTPITTYLPGFTVHSAFEANPERKITLRMLLSHTAGFTHEAPVGNNYAVNPGSFDAHIQSIADTWLRFPVGTGYAYSNLGIDLAGAILEKVYQKPFAVLMDDLLLRPLGMAHSSFDRTAIRTRADRATGRLLGIPAWLVDVPMTAAGGLYTSAADLARYLSFQIDGGTIDGHSVVDTSLLDEMRTVPVPNAGAPAGYALGISRTRWRAEGYQDLFSHGGGGFGFLSDLWFAPKIGIGIAIVTNSTDHQLQGSLAIEILRAFVDAPGSVFGARVAALPTQVDVVEPDGGLQTPTGYRELIAAAAMPATPGQPARWASYAGCYAAPSWGVINPMATPDQFVVDGGQVPFYETAETGSLVRHRLTEIQTGLFLADNGEMLDFRSSPVTWRNVVIVPVQGGPLPWQAALLGMAAVLALGWLVFGVLASIRRRFRRGGGGPPAIRGPRRTIEALALLTLIGIVAVDVLVLAMPGLVDAGFLGWVGFPLPVRLALHVPLLVAILAVAVAVVTLRAWATHAWPRVARWRYAALAAAGMAVTVQLLAWRMVGWGF